MQAHQQRSSVEVVTTVVKDRVILDLSPREAAQLYQVLGSVESAEHAYGFIRYAQENYAGYGDTVAQLRNAITKSGVDTLEDAIHSEEDR
jgi:hypothetical protein